jgi:hypothetical protein
LKVFLSSNFALVFPKQNRPVIFRGAKERSDMKNKLSVALALAGACSVTTIHAQFASTVVNYTPGTGVSSGYTDTSTVLGGPSTVTVDPDPMWGGTYPVDPFGAPYLNSQILGIGTGGSLTLQFNSPIQNNLNNPYGLDFIIFGHAGFNENFSTGTATDGSFYTGGDNGVTVSVSADGLTFYNLVSPFGTMVDDLFPTDGSGNPFLPVNPNLTASDFSGLTLSQIQALYGGSAGGAGFDLSWAVDGANQPISLDSIEYIRLQNSGDVAYIDALSAVSPVPEPTTGALAIVGAGLLWLNRRKK